MIIKSTPDDQMPSDAQRHAFPYDQDSVPGPASSSHILEEALRLLLAPNTDYHVRVQATRRLARCGPSTLPLVLATLSSTPEILVPAWPWWPPQYEHCSRLLANLCLKAELRLDELLKHPTLSEPAGPVLWISAIEATTHLPGTNYEDLLCAALASPWKTVRYASAITLATRAGRTTLAPATISALYACLDEEEDFPVRLTAAYTLLHCREYIGLDILLQLLNPKAPFEVRKAVTFLLATELPVHLSVAQREQLTTCLLYVLEDPLTEPELATQASHALSKVALPSLLPTLIDLLQAERPALQILALTTLEEIANSSMMRRMMRRHTLHTYIMPLLRSPESEVRRQACYTLASCGGEYVAAVFGTIALNREHPAHMEALEGLRMLRGVLRASIRENTVRWLLHALKDADEAVQVTALDSLSYILVQARTQGKRQALQEISGFIANDPLILLLLNVPGAWVRQRTIELLGLLWSPHTTFMPPQNEMLRLLTDSDSGVRACAAFVCGHIGARWAVPGLIQSLLDEDPHVSQTAFNALCQLTTTADPIFCAVLQELARLAQASQPYPLAQQALQILHKSQRQKP
ncbi:HEAT repeat domain-containing protein [Ktedonobacter sp. SOSP1-52]|uniref:HEAT repeat domain-containing protein n=1 Tax=Ktedonobacter sp. SOSP1-52 TaxID=2778366 RepID=UPI001F3B8603|nr:HEAT repeat domain-containing protein [Ktedonobacter sp. SOSP1-52]